MSARCEWLTVAGSPDDWRAIGLTLAPADDGSFLVPLIGTSLRIVPRDESPGDFRPDGLADARGIVGWTLSGVEAPSDGVIDGLPTEVVEAQPPVFAQHDLGATAIDHVVVFTDDLVRTTGAVEESTGCELKRVREAGTMRQGFHRLGSGGLIVEVVARSDAPVGPARFWGLVLIVDDLDAACALLGELVGPSKDAVQPGRRIATVRESAGLGLPVALMSA